MTAYSITATDHGDAATLNGGEPVTIAITLPGGGGEGGAVTSVNGQTGSVLTATVAQGALADSAVQPGDLATVATTGDYDDLTNTPTLGTAAAAATTDFDAAGAAATAQTTAEAYTDTQIAALDAASVEAVASVVAGDNITVDNTDPQNPIVSATGGTGSEVTSDDITDATVVGKAVLTATDAATARTAIGAGTSSFDGAYSSLTGAPTIPDSPDDIGAATAAQGALADTATLPADLGTAAAADTTDFATAAQGALADSATQPGDLGTAAALNVPATGDAASGEVVKGTDSRLTNARTPTTHTHAESDVTNLTTDLAAKAPLASPTLTGTPAAPTATAGTNTTQLATTAFVTNAVAKQKEVLIFALGDETTAITTGLKLTVRMPFAMTLSEVRGSLTTASSSGNPAVNIKESGTSIFSTTLTIDATELTSTTAATAAVISDANLADDAEITFFVDTAGTGAKGLKVTLIGTRA